VKGARGAVVAAAFLASACPRAPGGARDAGSDAPRRPADAASEAVTDAANAATDASAAPAPLPILGWVHPAREIVLPDGPRTTREGFLRAHGVASAPPDISCWSDHADQCSCESTITIDTANGAMDVLVCKRTVEIPRSGVLFSFVERSVLYSVELRAMKLLLDVPTRATVDAEYGPGEEVGSVRVSAVASPGGVSFVDRWATDEGPWCPQAVARAAKHRGQDWVPLKRWYAAVCATAGRYVLQNGRLVKGG
jgi:hypothetical protein